MEDCYLSLLVVCDDKIIAEFEEHNPEIIDVESGTRGIKIEKPGSTNYPYLSKKLQKEQLESRVRKVVREIKEAKAIQESIDKNKSLPKRFRINNHLVDVDYSIQTKLIELLEDDAIKLLEEKQTLFVNCIVVVKIQKPNGLFGFYDFINKNK